MLEGQLFLVTGGSGFIGWRVVKNLLQRPIPVVVADWSIDPEVRARLEAYGNQLIDFVNCDMAEVQNLTGLFDPTIPPRSPVNAAT